MTTGGEPPTKRVLKTWTWTRSHALGSARIRRMGSRNAAPEDRTRDSTLRRPAAASAVVVAAIAAPPVARPERCGSVDIGVSVAASRAGGLEKVKQPWSGQSGDLAGPLARATRARVPGRVRYGRGRECCAPDHDRRLDPDPGPAR